MEIGIIAFIIAIIVDGLIIFCLWYKDAAEAQNKAQELQKKKQEEVKLVQRYLYWWLHSKFNKFEIVKKYTVLSKDDQYRAVIRQVCTDIYEDESLSVNDWYRWKEGTFLEYYCVPLRYCLQIEAIEKFNKATSSELTYELAYRYIGFYLGIKKEECSIMSIRSRISWKKQDGTIESIYCHHDGYPKYVGNILVNNYNEKNLHELMALGDLSTLGEVPTSDPKGWSDYDYVKRNRCCLAYKDRGETNVDSLKFNSEEEFKEECTKGLEEECNYLYKDGKWYFWYEGRLKTVEDVENLL